MNRLAALAGPLGCASRQDSALRASQESRPSGRDLYLQFDEESGAARRRFPRASVSERVLPRGEAERSCERSESDVLR